MSILKQLFCALLTQTGMLGSRILSRAKIYLLLISGDSLIFTRMPETGNGAKKMMRHAANLKWSEIRQLTLSLKDFTKRKSYHIWISWDSRIFISCWRPFLREPCTMIILTATKTTILYSTFYLVSRAYYNRSYHLSQQGKKRVSHRDCRAS
jgi:hypothetical protein